LFRLIRIGSYQAQNDYDGVIDSLERALQIDSNNPDIMTPLALAYLKTERYEPAKKLLTLVTQIQSDNGTAYQHLSYCYLKLDDADGAVEAYSRAIEINDKDWQAHRGLGAAYMLKAANDKDHILKLKAIEQWKMSLAIKPDQPNYETLLRLIEKYSKQNR
jgi:tetratricopeptide (TPR) repeat protein